MPGLLRAVGRTAVIAGTATTLSNRVSRRQANRWAEQDAQQQEPPPQQDAAPPPAAPAPEQDRVQQLKELAALKDHGVLTDEEFAGEKARILGS